MSRTVQTDPIVLGHAMRDTINTYTREILVGKGLLNSEQQYILDSVVVRKEINLIINFFIEKWRFYEIDDAI